MLTPQRTDSARLSSCRSFSPSRHAFYTLSQQVREFSRQHIYKQLTSAGLFSKAVWAFEMHAWSKITGGDAAEAGSGPGSYNIKQSVWHVNCCNPEVNGGGGWGIFNSILGWTNSATYGSVISYNLYWLVVIVVFVSMRFYEKHGQWPLMKAKAKSLDAEDAEKSSMQACDALQVSSEGKAQMASTTAKVREVEA